MRNVTRELGTGTDTEPRILAIDPGPTASGWCTINATTHRPLGFGKTPNAHLLARLDGPWPGVGMGEPRSAFSAVIEMVGAYGMPVGAEVFDTCVWIGRYLQTLTDGGVPVDLVKRLPVRLHHCHSIKANDATVRQALIDRFAYGIPNYGKGTKANPGWFHGFAADIWSAYALAVYAADTTPTPTTDQ